MRLLSDRETNVLAIPVARRIPIREALGQMIRVLEAASKQENVQLDMDVFHSTSVLYDPEWGDRGTTFCGTRACVAGWSGMDPWFQARGFKTDVEGQTVVLMKGRNEINGGHALMSFFGITWREFYDSGLERLFVPAHGDDDYGFPPAIQRLEDYRRRLQEAGETEIEPRALWAMVDRNIKSIGVGSDGPDSTSGSQLSDVLPLDP